jgi:hypothetical protein
MTELTLLARIAKGRTDLDRWYRTWFRRIPDELEARAFALEVRRQAELLGVTPSALMQELSSG